MDTPHDLITTHEAKAILGCSRQKVTQLIKAGYLRCFKSPVDKRPNYVSRAEVEALAVKREEAA